MEMDYIELALMADQICSKVPPMSGFLLLSGPATNASSFSRRFYCAKIWSWTTRTDLFQSQGL